MQREEEGGCRIEAEKMTEKESFKIGKCLSGA